jgi:MFS family permease
VTTAGGSSLWRHRDFLKLWAGQSVSRLGSQVSLLALPLVAITGLHASTFEVGLLSAVEVAPFLLVGLPAGVVVDRVAKRPLLIAADVGRLLCLATIPLAYELGALTLIHLYAAAFVSGILTVFFDVAYQSYLPALVDQTELVDGNAKLAISDSAATVVGPTMAGVLIDLMGASLAVITDAVSFGLSAVALLLVRRREPGVPTRAGEERPGLRTQIGEGLGFLFRHPVLRPVACCTATSNLFSSMAMAVVTVYMVRTLGLSPGMIGLTLGLGNIGVLVGAVTAARVTRRFGVGRATVGAIAVSGLGFLLVPLATPAVPLPWLIAGYFLFALGSPVYNINQVSLRQAITPYRMQGRLHASMRFVVWGTMPIGSLVGGALGTLIGLRPTLVVAGLGGAMAFVWIALSPLPGIHRMPSGVEQEAS